MEEKISAPFSGMVMTYSPSASVLTPTMVPSRWTEAKGTGSSVDASVTLPLTVREVSCADAAIAVKAVRNVKINLILTIINGNTYNVSMIVNKGQTPPMAFFVPETRIIKSGRFLRRDRPLANIYVINQKGFS